MTTITAAANVLEGLQARITADKAALLEAKAMLTAEHNQVVDALNARHIKLMAFIDGQIAARDNAIDDPEETMAVVEYRQAAE